MPARALNLSEIGLDRRRAMIDFENGEIPRAELQLTRLVSDLESAQPLSGALLAELYRAYHDRATLRRRANRWDEALEDLEFAERLESNLPVFVRADSQAITAHARAKILADEFYPAHDRDEALRQLEILSRSQMFKFAADEMESDLAFRAGEWDRAARLSLDAARQIEAMGFKTGAAICRRRAADSLIEMGQLDDANVLLAKLREQIDRYGTPVDVAYTEMTQACLLSSWGKSDLAWAAALKALSRFDEMIRKFSSILDQQRFLVDKLRQYEKAFRIALKGDGAQARWRAWSVAERSKSFYLCQLLASADVPLFAGVDQSLIEALDESDGELSRLEWNYRSLGTTDKNGERGRQIARLISDASSKKRLLLERIMRDHPRWARVTRPTDLDMQKEARHLPKGWVPLSYFWENDSGPPNTNGPPTVLHLFWSSGTEPRHHRVEWDRESLGMLADARSRMRGKVRINATLLPRRLSNLIIPPELVQDLPAGDRILLSPHGLLQMTPIHAVKLPSHDYTAAIWPFQYIPTFALLPLAREPSRSNKVLLLGCEQDDFGGARLNEVGPELRSLENVWSSANGFEVTNRLIPRHSSVGDEGLSVDTWDQYGIIHIACHGVFPAGQPFEASLRLGNDAVSTSDLFADPAKPRLISFSSCAVGRHAESSTHHLIAGDEWIGLHLPLLYGGTQFIIGSLWDVQSTLAAEFMKYLHTAVSRGDELAAAVQWAQDRTASTSKDDLPARWANWYPVGFPTRDA